MKSKDVKLYFSIFTSQESLILVGFHCSEGVNVLFAYSLNRFLASVHVQNDKNMLIEQFPPPKIYKRFITLFL